MYKNIIYIQHLNQFEYVLHDLKNVEQKTLTGLTKCSTPKCDSKEKKKKQQTLNRILYLPPPPTHDKYLKHFASLFEKGGHGRKQN